jgi:hypothetical protein
MASLQEGSGSTCSDTVTGGHIQSATGEYESTEVEGNVRAKPVMMLLLHFVTDTIKAQHGVWRRRAYCRSHGWRKCPQVLCICALTSQEKGTAKTWGYGSASLTTPLLVC